MHDTLLPEHNTVKPAYNGMASDRNFSVADRFPYVQVLEIWTLGSVSVFR
jgi:hypothetical protein